MRKLMNKVIGTTLAIAMVVTCMPVANVKNVHAAEKKRIQHISLYGVMNLMEHHLI